MVCNWSVLQFVSKFVRVPLYAKTLCEFLSLPQENPLDIDMLLKLVYCSSPFNFSKMLGSLFEEEVLYSRMEIMKQKELGDQKRELEAVWEGGGVSHFTLRGSLHVTRMRCTARHEWQWWALWAWDPAFSTPPNSPGQASPSLWQDEETLCQLKCDSLPFIHWLNQSLTPTPCRSFVYLSFLFYA